MSKPKIKFVGSGSGTLLYYFIGVLKRLLEDYELEESIDTSGSSIILAFLSVGYTITDIINIVKNIDLKKCADISINPFDKLGVFSGDYIEKYLSEYLDQKEVKIPITIVTTNLTDKKPEYFYFDKYYIPTLSKPLSKIVRASMSIPVLFKYIILDKKIYVDGGLCDNFAIDFFKDKNTIGVKIETPFIPKVRNKDNFLSKAKNFFSEKLGINYLLSLIEIMMIANEKKHIEDAIFEKILVIKSDRSFTDFNFSIKDIDDMIKDGYNQMNIFLKDKDFNI